MIKIEIYDAFAGLPSEQCRSIIGDALKYCRVQFVPCQDGPIRERVLESTLWDVATDGRLRIPVGLAHKIAALLRMADLKVKVVDHRRFGPRHQTDERYRKAAALEEDRVMLDCVRQHPRGQLQVSSFDQAIEWMVEIVRYFQKARAIIPVSTRDLARNVCWKLQQQLGSQVKLHLPGRSLPKAKYVVTTFRPLVRCDNDWDLVLLPDPHGAVQHQAAISLGSVWPENKRIYAFVESRLKLAPESELLLEAMTGPVIVRQVPETAEVRVLWLGCPSCPAIATKESLAFKRQAYWHNDRRNDYVAAVARAVAKNDVVKLRKYGLPMANGEPDICGGSQPHVIVLAEATEHAAELHQRLPDWEVQTLRDPERTPKDMHRQRRQIVTVSVAQRDGLQADAVIVASGEPAQLQIPGFPTPRSVHDNRPVLLVDFQDKFDKRSLTRAQERRKLATRNGWIPMERTQSRQPLTAKQEQQEL